MRRITPVILAGGSGTRLWPVSRKSFPKQFAQLVSNESLFQTSARRMAVSAFAAPIVMTSANFRFIISDQLAEIGIQPDEVIIEPSPRNTAPAILAAALKVASRGPEELVLVAPSDHVIPDDSAFLSAVQRGIRLAEEGSIVTFGVKPDRAETGYGYLELAFPADAPQPLKRFVEKPGLAEAKQMLEQGNYLWNSGIFLFKAKTLIDAFRLHADHYIHPVSRALSDATVDLSFTRLATSAWDGLPDQSVDYAVLEKVNNIAVVPLNTRWSDLGGWDAVWRESLVDTAVPDGVVADSFSTAIDCKNVLLTSDSADLHVVGIGLQDLVVVATGDAVLVADKSRTEEVKHAVSCLKERGHRQAVAFRKDRRPWGWYETLALEDRFQVKRIVVKPGASLSLQSHFHRSEHWIVVSGTAKVTVDDVVTLVTENQSIYVPLGSRHRMENPGKFPMVLIEVQTGAYLGEDDIVRYEDIYSREPVG